ncbi:hypothetical protein D3C87_1508310 [compost metagenome]
MESFAFYVVQRRVENKAFEDAVAVAAVPILIGEDQCVLPQILDAQFVKGDGMFIEIRKVPADVDIVIHEAAPGTREGHIKIVAIIDDFRDGDIKVGIPRAECRQEAPIQCFYLRWVSYRHDVLNFRERVLVGFALV